MARPTVLETLPAAVGAVFAVCIGVTLAGHHVGIAVIVSVVLSLLSTGLLVGTQLQQAAHTRTFTCPEAGCPVQIRVTDRRLTDVARLRELAADHTRHGAPRA